jgi:primosomal replication protein N
MDTDGVKGKWKIIIIMASGRCVCVWKVQRSTEHGEWRMENGQSKLVAFSRKIAIRGQKSQEKWW